MIRKWVFEQINLATGFTIPPERVTSGAQSGVQGDSPTRPFAAVHIGQEQTHNSGLAIDVPFEVWVHSDPGSYLFIDAELLGLQTHFAAAYPARVLTSAIFDVIWEGNSPDLKDDNFRTIVRFGTWRIRWRR